MLCKEAARGRGTATASLPVVTRKEELSGLSEKGGDSHVSLCMLWLRILVDIPGHHDRYDSSLLLYDEGTDGLDVSARVPRRQGGWGKERHGSAELSAQ